MLYLFIIVQILCSSLSLKVFFFLITFPVGISSSQTSDCSYSGLLNNLDLATTNELLTIMRPVKNWTNPTRVQLDMVMYGILDVVRVFIVLYEYCMKKRGHRFLECIYFLTYTFTHVLCLNTILSLSILYHFTPLNFRG